MARCISAVGTEPLRARFGTGDLRWKFKTGDVVHASPALADGVLFFGSWDSYFYAVDAATGKEKWRSTEAKTDDPQSGGVPIFACGGERNGLHRLS